MRRSFYPESFPHRLNNRLLVTRLGTLAKRLGVDHDLVPVIHRRHEVGDCCKVRPVGSAMNSTFSSHARAIFRLLMMPR